MSYLSDYLTKNQDPSAAAVSFYASLDSVSKISPTISSAIIQELKDQRSNLKMIASENYTSLEVQQAMGNLLTDKYAEGIPGARFYSGCDNIDTIEKEAVNLAKQLFSADHAYVQPHSGADANLVAFLAILAAKTQQDFLSKLSVQDLKSLTPFQFQSLRKSLSEAKLLGLDISSGGHLTHGYRLNISAQLFNCEHYHVSKETGLIDYASLRAQAKEFRPLILLAGFSAYPGKLNFHELRSIADEIGAVLMVDMAHFAGLVAGKVYTGEYNPVPYADIITSTTHKTLRGPRGGLILCKTWLKEYVDKGCPMVLGGPLPHIMAAKALAFKEALSPNFIDYSNRIVENSKSLCMSFLKQNIHIQSNATENHLLLLNVEKSFGLTGRQAEKALREAGIVVNRNALPFDQNGVWYTSGLRLGTPALTTLGFLPTEMPEIADLIIKTLSNTSPLLNPDQTKNQSQYNLNPAIALEVKTQVQSLLAKHPLYPELNLF